MKTSRLLATAATLLATAASAVVVPAAQAAPTRTAPTAAVSGHTPKERPVLRVTGAVQHRERLTLTDLRALPQRTVTTTYTAAGVPTTKTFTGPLLLDVLDAAGPRFDPADKNDALAFAVRAHATDGYRAVVAWGEIDPGFEGKQVLVALTDGGAPLDRPRLVVPGDAKGGRYVSGLDSLRLVDLGR